MPEKVSITKNYALNLINTVSGLLFPLITFPYASRILMADGIGKVQFFQSIINYISLFTALGIPLYAVREIARVRDNKKEYSKTATEILILHASLTLIGYFIVFILATTVVKIQLDIPLFTLLSTSLFFTSIGASWFFQALEDFKYITIRSISTRIISLIGLFLLVKTKNDLLLYSGIIVISDVGSNIFNFFRLRKYIDLHSLDFRNLKIMRHLKPALKIFVLNLIISIYVNLDSIMLGFLKNEQAVGYYAAASRLTKTMLGVVSSLGVVLLPRFSNMISNNMLDEFRLLANKAISLTIAISFPMTIGLIALAPSIIHIFCGSGFEPSVLTLQIIAPIIIFIGVSNILGIQILYPQGKEIIVIIATTAGAIVNFSLNYILIPKYGQFGAAIATTIAEFTVPIILIIVGNKHLPITFLSKQNSNYILASILILVILQTIHALELNDIVELCFSIFFSALFYYTFLFYLKDEYAIKIYKFIITKLNKK